MAPMWPLNCLARYQNSPRTMQILWNMKQKGETFQGHHVFTMFSRCKMSAAPHELSSDNVPQLYCAILGSDDPFSDWWKLWQSKVLSDVGHLCKKAMPDSEPGTTMPRTSISPDLNQCHSFQSIWSHLPLGNDAVSTPELFSYICFLLLGFTQRGKKTPTQNQVGKKKLSKGPAAPMSPISLSHIYTQSSWPSLEAWL